MKNFCYFFIVFCLIFSSLIYAHEGHHHSETELIGENEESVSSFLDEKNVTQTIQKIGHLHPLFLHFPIALVIMTGIAEALNLFYRRTLFSEAAWFMILSAAILAVPTALFGLAFGYGVPYEGLARELYWWHRFFGLLTPLLIILTAYTKTQFIKHPPKGKILYPIFLLLCIGSVLITGFLGGSLTFGF